MIVRASEADTILATLTSKGQITLPAQHRKAWGLKPGDQMPSIRLTGICPD